MRALAVFILVFFFPSIAHADPTPPVFKPLTAVPAGDDVVVSMKEGEKSPFAGQLFAPPTALRWANYLKQCELRLQLDPMTQYNVDMAFIQAGNAKLDVERKKYDDTVKELNAKLAKAQADAADPPFYRTFWFGATMGITAAILLVGAGAFIVSAVK